MSHGLTPGQKCPILHLSLRLLLMKTNYRVIGFGHNEHGFFNQFVFRSDLSSARIAYSHFWQDPEMDGAVVIEVNHEDWKVIHEFGTKGYSVEYGVLGTFKVVKSPELCMV